MKIIRFEIMREQEDTQILEPMQFDSPDETFEANFALAKSLACNGEVTVEEVEDEEGPAPTIEERVTTLEESNAEMTEALDLILSGVTE